MSPPLFFMIPGAPTPVAPFSHAVEADGWCFVTGQMPTDPVDDTKPLAPDIEGQTVRVAGQFRGRNLFGDLPSSSERSRSIRPTSRVRWSLRSLRKTNA